MRLGVARFGQGLLTIMLSAMAVANFLGITRLEPFLVGAFALLALAASILPLYAAIRRHIA
jgi:hypothetical protein